MKVLVIDDDSLFTTIVGNCLTAAGNEIRTSLNGEDALNYLEEFRPDLVICDWRLPGEIQALDLFSRAVQMNPEIRLAVFTGMPPDSLKDALKPFPRVRVIEKPIDLDELEKQVLSLLREPN